MKDTAKLVDELKQEINERKELIAQVEKHALLAFIVSPSYPNILREEISRLEKAKFELMKK